MSARAARKLDFARSAVTGTHAPAWRDLARFATVSFPVAVYRVTPVKVLAFGQGTFTQTRHTF